MVTTPKPAPLNLAQTTHTTHATHTTLASYANRAEAFWEGSRDHDVSQNINALLSHIKGRPPFTILDMGCGPGRVVTMKKGGAGKMATAKALVALCRENNPLAPIGCR